MKTVKIVFAGGGTGGHIYPGLAVCDEVRALYKEKNIPVELFWMGNSSGMDKKLVEKSGSVDKFVGIPSGKLRRYFSFQNFFDLFKIGFGLIKSFFKLLSIRPDMVFSKGGFVSVTPCMAAKLLRIPVFTHECDFTPGLATKLNSKSAKKILVTYEETKKYLGEAKAARAIVTGNPVRPVFYNPDPQNGKKFLFENRDDYDPSKPVLMILGGSLGAHQINELVVQNLEWLTERYNVVHQCGAKDFESMPVNVKGYFCHDFIYSEMCDCISAADVILARAGANSIWECSVLGKPMVLIPLCGSGTRGDQVDNAQYFVDHGAAISLVGDEATSDNLKKALIKYQDEGFRKNASEKSAGLSKDRRPSKIIAQLIWEEINNE